MAVRFLSGVGVTGGRGRGGVGGGELLVAVEQRGDPGHGGPVPFRGGCHGRAGAGVPTPCRSAMPRIAAASRSGCSAVVRWPPGKVRIVASGTRSRVAVTCRCS